MPHTFIMVFLIYNKNKVVIQRKELGYVMSHNSVLPRSAKKN